MSSIQERLQLKRIPLDTWNIREQLCLASAVVRSGDQNWMSVSRALKAVGEPNRPPDWYSQKSCAAQYGVLLEHVETPKRKKRSSEGAMETPQESILKRLTQERTVEIQKTVAEMNQQYEQLKNEILEVRNPSTSDDRLREIWAGIEAAKRAREREMARRAAWLKERDEKRARAERTWRPPAAGAAPAPVTTAPTTQPPSSPLLTSLLKSSPVVTTPQHISHPANVVETVSPSAGAPTLSMLLESRAAAAGAPGAPGAPGASAGAPAGSPHEKHAAIEHIKSQLVQIEQQLKASSAGPAAPDIDDIEIKAEDVYVFRDVDLHIPPVTPLHKTASTHTSASISVRMTESPLIKKDEIEPITPAVEEPTPQLLTNIKQQPAEEEADPQDNMQADIETSTEEPSTIDEPPKEESSSDHELKISFPEVKFPTTEIKVIQPDEVKIKEEIKEPEPQTPVLEPEKVAEEVVVEEMAPTEQESDKQEIEKELEHPEQESEQRPIEEIPVPPVVEEPLPVVQDPETIPLPPEPVPVIEAEKEQAVTEIPVLAEPEPESEEPKEEKENDITLQEEKAEDVQTIKEEVTEHDDVKKDEDAEDSIPLKDMIKAQESESDKKEEVQQEVKEERAEQEDTHTETDDDTPMELSREEEKDGKKKRDYSRKKKPDSRTCSGSESAAEASAPESPSATEAEKQHRLWKKSVMLVYSRLCGHKYASLFLRPISDDEAPGYSLVVKRPMDLTTVKRNIDQGGIRTTAEFQRDVLLMLSNALMYNSSEHSVYQMAKEMHEEAQCQLGMLLAAQAHAGLAPAPPAARRKRRRSPAADALALALALPPAKRVH